MKRILYFLIIALMIASCSGNRLNYDKGIIPTVPVNFSSVNSSYDDYNSNLQISWTERFFSLIFSTNRNSNGNNFDFISYNGHIIFDLLDGEFEMHASSRDYGLLEAVNNSSNQFGPYLTTDIPYDAYWMKEGEDRRFFYSSDPDGSLDIFCCKYEFGENVFNPLGDPFPVSALNTEYDEGYLSVHSGAAMNRETVYFMSDREGSFDIYHAIGEEGMLISESSAVTVTRSSVLSSSADDKCPYIYGSVIVFASDREGGFGGFDLWYSVFNGQQWAVPVNMGGDINTEYDEYRPFVVATEDSYVNDLMVFSSNRPGGNGGFDLYYVGIPRREYVPGIFAPN